MSHRPSLPCCPLIPSISRLPLFSPLPFSPYVIYIPLWFPLPLSYLLLSPHSELSPLLHLSSLIISFSPNPRIFSPLFRYLTPKPHSSLGNCNSLTEASRVTGLSTVLLAVVVVAPRFELRCNGLLWGYMVFCCVRGEGENGPCVVCLCCALVQAGSVGG